MINEKKEQCSPLYSLQSGEKISLHCKYFYVLQWFFMVSSVLTLVSRKLYLVRVFLSQRFTISRNMHLDIFYIYIYIYIFNVFIIFCVFNSENTEVGYESLTEWILGGLSDLNFS